MNKSVFLATAVAITLTACAAGRIGDKGFSPLLVTAPDPSRPNVFVKDDAYVVVDQEPVYVVSDAPSIAWAVANNANYYFPSDDAISIQPPRPNGFTCTRPAVSRPQVITCTYERVHNKKYIYTITVTDGTRTLKSDPSIMNP